MRIPTSYFFERRSLSTWLLILATVIYFAFSWVMYTVAVDPVYNTLNAPTIQADSDTYFQMAGIDVSAGVDRGSLINFGGSSLGPVAMALVGRGRFGVACINYVLFLLVLWWAGMVPGVRRGHFAILMAIEAQTLPTLMTLNKEILAIAGLVSFAAFLYGGLPRGKRYGSGWLLAVSMVFSLFARWEQIVIPIWYLVAEFRWSGMGGRPRRSIVVLLLLCSAFWAVAVNVLHLNLKGFVAQLDGAGLAARLYAIQEKGGFFLIALPKTIMMLAGRLVTPGFFLRDYWDQDFQGSWQNAYIGFISNVAMVALPLWMVLKGRFRLSRPLVYLAVIYFIFTAINPFIQPRYAYPAYALLAMEMSRREESLEPVGPLYTMPRLAPSYRILQTQPSSGQAVLGK